MEIENLSEKVKQAKEAVESLEEPLKTEAFKKILDKLLETPVQIASTFPEQINPQIPVRSIEKTKRKKKSTQNNFGKINQKAKEESEKRKRELANKISRSQYQNIYELKSILPKALYVLFIMKEKGVKGLTPPEIQFILKEVFSIKQTSESISVALNRKEAMKYTDRNRITVGRAIAYVYEIMIDGENFIKKVLGKQNNNHEDKTNDREEPNLA